MSGIYLGLCKKVVQRGTMSRICDIKHVKKYCACNTCVVYCIPLSCDKFYVGQSGRCVNVRLREHENLLPTGTGGNLPLHCKLCGCSPLFDKVTILGKAKTQREREIIEAFHIWNLVQTNALVRLRFILPGKNFCF